MRSNTFRIGSLLALAITACGGDDGTGGNTGAGGQTEPGTTGTVVATGGQIATLGGSSAIGGNTASLGGTSNGGLGGATTAEGGNTAAPGGTTSTGGGSSTGGASSTAGSSSQWPQCYAKDTMPANPTLKQRAPASDYATMLTNNTYVAMLIGPQRPSCLTDAVANRDLTELNAGIKDVVEVLGFPAFPDWKAGYYLNWVILNSGIPGATNSGEGGHQGNRWGHMNFESTQQCPCTWDSYNSGAALHECIHALQAELWKYNNEASGWIHEAHNCYLGTQREYLGNKKYTMGYGAAAAMSMPFVPIESMGLLTDDTIGGPADQLAQGKTYVNSIVRYGLEIFFLSLSLEMGRGFVNCLWLDAPANNQKSIFQVMKSFSSPEAVSHAILSYGARSSLLDFGDWTGAVRTMMQGNWNNNYWFYMFPSGDGTTTFSPPTKQIPHHQGRNVIPIKVSSGATSVVVEFTPDASGSKGTKSNMRAQLTYRTADDKPVYGKETATGQVSIDVPSGVRSGIVNLVVAATNVNADTGSDDGSGKGFDGQEHFNYKARIVSGGVIAPTTTRPW